ncbi:MULTISPECIES: hypothetical protein [unclassified Ruegeria]|uniref:hypothetical protein n=1 Tax=unclassified Ruegeria TaxID=2625375 RepID=UPI0014889B0D|nr:hypothetical protein [Ruegeria sp. HKCCD8929]
MRDRKIAPAPDYTRAALTMLGVNLLWIFFVVWMIWGFAATLVLAVMIDYGITWLAARLD